MNKNNHKEVGRLNDGISSLAWSPKANFLVASCWNNELYCWDINNNCKAVSKTQAHEQPVLCSVWNTDGSKVLSGGCDNLGRCWNLSDNSVTTVAKHDAPIKCIALCESNNMVVTAGWDKQLKYWDLRQATGNAALSTPLPERAYSMDIKGDLCVVATAGKHIVTYNLRNPNKVFQHYESPLKCQSRILSCFQDKSGFALGSIEGRVAVQAVGPENAPRNSDTKKSFAFKCHRNGTEVYAVNVIDFHKFGTFVTAGADGIFHFWDKDSRQRLKKFDQCGGPISAGKFSTDGTLFAYSVSYDWSKGCQFFNQNDPNIIYVHKLAESDIKPRSK